jgi:hypothetical protein
MEKGTKAEEGRLHKSRRGRRNMSRRKEQERLKEKGATEERWNRSKRGKTEEEEREETGAREGRKRTRRGKRERADIGAERREIGEEASSSVGEVGRRQCSSSTLIDSLNNQSS